MSAARRNDHNFEFEQSVNQRWCMCVQTCTNLEVKHSVRFEIARRWIQQWRSMCMQHELPRYAVLNTGTLIHVRCHTKYCIAPCRNSVRQHFLLSISQNSRTRSRSPESKSKGSLEHNLELNTPHEQDGQDRQATQQNR
jgi:hypothetical protein